MIQKFEKKIQSPTVWKKGHLIFRGGAYAPNTPTQLHH